MSDLIRDAPIGQIIRYFTRNRVLLYPEERADFVLPPSYASHSHAAQAAREKLSVVSTNNSSTIPPAEPEDPEKAGVEPVEQSRDRTSSQEDAIAAREALERFDTSHSHEQRNLEKLETSQSHQLSHVGTRAALSQSHTRADLEAAVTAATLAPEPSRPIIPERTSDGNVLVDWYTTDDQSNPQNWSFGKKMFASTQIYIYTLAVYMGSAIYTPSEIGVMKEFGVSQEAASLGLAIYVLAYGIGPLIFSPLSEIPVIGRNPPYILTMALFVILCVPTALVDNFAGLIVLRFLQGFFGSPCLATGGASLQDMYSLNKLPYVLCLWALSATCGPALGPIISGFSVAAENWRWSLWEMLWLSGPVFIMMLLFLPETSTSNILLRRAQRLRKLTGDEHFRSQSEIDQANMRPSAVAFEALVRPWQLIFMDPAIGFTAGYVALCYGIYYSFFEAFPLVYVDVYHFNLGEVGLTFLSITVAVILSIALYYSWIYFIVEPRVRKNGMGAPEPALIPALLASILLPIGLFIFGWTGRTDIHWIVSVIGVLLFTMGVFIVIQCVFLYLPMVYPQYAASLFAGNDAARSMIAFAAVLFSRPMYIGMGVGPGVSLLGALTAACIAGVFILFFYGGKLRSRSKFSAK